MKCLLHSALFSNAFLIESNLVSENPTKWSNTLKQFVGKMPTNCLSLFDHFVKLALKRLIEYNMIDNFLDKSHTKCGGETIPRAFSKQ